MFVYSDLYWIDGGICTEKFLELKHFQVSLMPLSVPLQLANNMFIICSMSTTFQGWERFVEKIHLAETWRSNYILCISSWGYLIQWYFISPPCVRLRKLHKEEYNFVPRTWVLPGEYNSLAYHMRDLKRKRKNKTFIIKPHNAAMGNG